MPSIVAGFAMNTGTPRATSAPTCAGAAKGHVTTRSGSEQEDALEVERARIADLRLRRRLRRPIGRGEHADDAIAGAGGVQELRRMRREAHDARRGGRERHRRAGIVDRLHRGARRGQPGDAASASGKHPPARRDAHRSTARNPANTVAPPVPKPGGELVVLVEDVVGAREQRDAGRHRPFGREVDDARSRPSSRDWPDPRSAATTR